jgi:hypothetical protein
MRRDTRQSETSLGDMRRAILFICVEGAKLKGDKTMKAKAAAKAPEKINPLTEYLVNESTREGAGPDAETNAQIDLLMSEDESHEQEGSDQEPPKASPATKRRKPAPKKAAKSRGKKKR